MLELARESDWDAIRRLSIQIHDLHVSWRPDIYCHSDEPYAKGQFLEDIRSRMVYVAKLQQTVVGYTVLSIRVKSGPGVVEKKEQPSRTERAPKVDEEVEPVRRVAPAPKEKKRDSQKTTDSIEVIDFNDL